MKKKLHTSNDLCCCGDFCCCFPVTTVSMRCWKASATAAVNASAGFTVLILTKYVNAHLPQMI